MPVDPEAIEAEPDHQPGMAELSTISVLNKEWDTISIEQRGPDGSEVLAMLLFYSCPLCSAVIPPPNEETGENFGRYHAMFHIKQARDFDVLNSLLRALALSESEGL